jgi:hypothetical protein
LKGKFIPTCQQYGVVGHVKIDCLNLGNRFANKSQDLEYKIDLVLNQLCIVEKKHGKLVGGGKSQEIENSNRTKLKN